MRGHGRVADGPPLDGVQEGVHVLLGDEEELQAPRQIQVALGALLVEVGDARHGRPQEVLTQVGNDSGELLSMDLYTVLCIFFLLFFNSKLRQCVCVCACVCVCVCVCVRACICLSFHCQPYIYQKLVKQ